MIKLAIYSNFYLALILSPHLPCSNDYGVPCKFAQATRNSRPLVCDVTLAVISEPMLTLDMAPPSCVNQKISPVNCQLQLMNIVFSSQNVSCFLQITTFLQIGTSCEFIYENKFLVLYTTFSIVPYCTRLELSCEFLTCTVFAQIEQLTVVH